MNETDALDLLQLAIWTVILTSGPGVIAAMVAGIAIGTLQALTQVQEATLTFVPKILGVFIAVLLSAYFIGANLGSFAVYTFSRIEAGF